MTGSTETSADQDRTALTLDALIVGAGFGGIYALHKLRGMGLSVKAFEQGAGVGGTWYWNRYPGARCDVASMEYSYSFSDELQQEWTWSEVHATQPEIERYANHVVDRFDLRRDICLNTAVRAARWDEAAKLWRIETGDGGQVLATYLILATGGYGAPIAPDLEGMDAFRGELYFSNQYPTKAIDYAGKTIGVIGTGSSGHQITAALGKQPIKQLYVFQRSPAYLVPSNDRPLEPDEIAEHKRTYVERRERARHTGFGVDVPPFKTGGQTTELSEEEFQARAWAMWREGGGTAAQVAFPDFAADEGANRRLADWLNARTRDVIDDPKVADSLCDHGYFVGEKRIVVIDNYVETLRKPNVTLVDIRRQALLGITERGVRTTEREYDLDLLILATGFDSATGSILKIDIHGRDGLTMREKWRRALPTYLGLGVHGFPNMFIIAQTGSPGIRSHVMVSIEQHVQWIAELLAHAKAHAVETIEPTESAEADWAQHQADIAGGTLLRVHDTHHVGSNVPGKPRVVTSYLGGVGAYRRICDLVRDRAYEGWTLMTHAGPLPNAPDWSGPGADVSWAARERAAAGKALVD